MERTKRSTAPKLDSLDLKLVEELEIDARQSLRDIAGKVGSNPETIRRKLKNLLDSRVISIHAICDVVALGFDTRALITLKVRPGTASSVADRLQEYHSIHKISLTAGHYDILLSTNFLNKRALISFLEGELGSITDILEASTMMLLQLRKNSFRYLHGETTEMKHIPPYEPDEWDLKLMKELELEPRELVGNLGKKIGMNRISAGKKLQALMDKDIIRVVSIIDPLSFDFQSEVVILVKTHPRQITSVADRMVTDGRVHHVGIITGPYNLFLAAIFRDSMELSGFLADELGMVSGVISHETMVILTSPRLCFFAATQRDAIKSTRKSPDKGA